MPQGETAATEAPPEVLDAPLSSEDAVELLTEKPETEEAPEPAQEEPAAEEPEADEPAPEEDQPEVPAEPVNAPHYWTAEQKARFAELPADLQEAVADNERNRERHVQKVVQDHSEATKAMAAARQEIDAALQAFQTNEELRGQIDWTAWLRENPGEALAAQHTMQQLQAARQRAEQAELAKFQAEEGQKLPAIAPDLADPKKLSSVYTFLAERGIPQAQLPQASAIELSIAYDAMRWREAQAAARTPKPRAVEPPRKPAKPSAALPGTSEQRSTETLSRRFAQTKSADDAVALIMAKGL